MAFYKFYDAPVYFNGQNLAAQSVSMSVQAQIDADHTIGSKYRRGINAVNGLQGKVQFEYILTGSDPLYNYLMQDSGISGSVASITFKNGYISSYSVGADAKSFVKASVTINIYGNLSGNFFAASLGNISGKAARGSTTDLSGANIVNALSFNYSVSTDIKPSYNIGEYEPFRVVIGKKQAEMQVESDKLQEILLVTGNYAQTRVDIRNDFCGTGIVQSYVASGNLTSLEIGGTTNGNGLIAGRATIQDLI